MLGSYIYHNGRQFATHTSLKKNQTALSTFSTNQLILIGSVLLYLFVFLLVSGFFKTLLLLIAVVTFVYFADLLFNLFLILNSFRKPPEITVTEDDLQTIPETQLPTYSILCPLYKEWKVLPQFVKAMERIDYPKKRMEVILLLEEDDTKTIETAHKLNLPDFFRIMIVPHSQPKTKPKALNFGLSHARGQLAVVYDAEDVPDPLQLKKAVHAFRKAGERVVCIQAKLNFYNPKQNLLTRVFTTEYSLWFDLVLTGLQTIKAPIPLGGTSNHFRTKDLRLLEGWDPFNVTEDCDLGIRLFKKGYHTAMFNSTTLEEANSNFKNWLRQRSRWIKGYIQTYLVHMRRPREFVTDRSTMHVLTFQLIVGGKIASIFINPLMWVTTISYFAFRPIVGPAIEAFFPPVVFYFAVFSLVAGNFLYLYYYMIGCAKREQWNIIEYAYLVPVYWLMMSAAAWYALYQLVFKPHYWEKTHHGFHLGTIREIFGVRLAARYD